jgi:hypothetical protein
MPVGRRRMVCRSVFPAVSYAQSRPRRLQRARCRAAPPRRWPRAFEHCADVLDKVELFVAGGGPEILPVIGQVVLLLLALVVGEGHAAFLAEGWIRQHIVVAFAGSATSASLLETGSSPRRSRRCCAETGSSGRDAACWRRSHCRKRCSFFRKAFCALSSAGFFVVRKS